MYPPQSKSRDFITTTLASPRMIDNKHRLRQFFAFFWGSAVGLLIDLGGFQAFLALGYAPWVANLISASLSITAVYFLVTRYSFAASARAQTYVLFLAWYGSSILIFSALIQFASIEFGLLPIFWKLLSVPVSFSLNYMFSTYLLTARPTPSPLEK